MLDLIDAVLKTRLEKIAASALITDSETIKIAFDAPTQKTIANLDIPIISVYMYDIREDTSRRQAGTIRTREPESSRDKIKRDFRTFESPRHIRVSYMLTAWAKHPPDAHKLLGHLFMDIAQDPEIYVAPLTWDNWATPEEFNDFYYRYPPDNKEGDISIGIAIGEAPAEEAHTSSMWSSFQSPLSPFLNLTLTFPLPTSKYIFHEKGVLIRSDKIILDWDFPDPTSRNRTWIKREAEAERNKKDLNRRSNQNRPPH